MPNASDALSDRAVALNVSMDADKDAGFALAASGTITHVKSRAQRAKE
jgi:hypothetical protein